MRRRRSADEPVLSLDSFLDIVTNVVGVLILVAVVTVLSAGEIAVAASPTAARAPGAQAARILFECAEGQLYFVDEEAISRQLRKHIHGDGDAPADVAVPAERAEEKYSWGAGDIEDDDEVADGADEDWSAALEGADVGDANYRVKPEWGAAGLAWRYRRRATAKGESQAQLADEGSAFRKKLDELPAGTFVYFVVRDDSFEVFRKARALAAARGIAVGWHPVPNGTVLRLSASGGLGKRIQ